MRARHTRIPCLSHTFTYCVPSGPFTPAGTCDLASFRTAQKEVLTIRNHGTPQGLGKEWHPHQTDAARAGQTPRRTAWARCLQKAAEAAAGSLRTPPRRTRTAAGTARLQRPLPWRFPPLPSQRPAGPQGGSKLPADSSHLQRVHVNASSNTSCFPKPTNYSEEVCSGNTGALECAYVHARTHTRMHTCTRAHARTHTRKQITYRKSKAPTGGLVHLAN